MEKINGSYLAQIRAEKRRRVEDNPLGDFLEENERHGIKITSSNGNSSSPPKGQICLKMSCDSGFAEDTCVEETSNVEVKNIEPHVGAMKQRGESHPGAGLATNSIIFCFLFLETH